METTEQFLDKMYEIEQELQNLSHQYNDLYQEFEGEDFGNQNSIAADFENAMLALTHETASNIRFERIRIHLLVKYIQFRKEFKVFSDGQLAQIIDNELTIASKLDLIKDFEGDKKQFLEQISQLKTVWNNIFNNKSYAFIKKEIRLTI